jgi:putative MATE family efflux protein
MQESESVDATAAAVTAASAGAAGGGAAEDEAGAERLPFRKLLREALAGTHRDYTSGPIPRAIFLLAVPMVVEMAMESLFALVDIFWVSRLGRDEATAVVGTTESMLAILYAIAMGLAMSATATIARRIGEKDRDGAASFAVQAIALGILAAIPLGIGGALGARTFLRWMGTSPEAIASCGRFTVIMLGGNATILLLFLMNSVFRGAGDATIAMRTLWLANGINLLLDPCLIYGVGPFPRLGVVGAAVATNCGRGIGVLYQLWRLSRGSTHLKILRRHLRLVPSRMATLVRLAGAGILQQAIATMSWTFLVWLLGTFSAAAVAGYTIGLRVIIFGLLPSWGMANAAATMVGQSLGARLPQRAERAVWLAGFYNMLFLGGVGLLFVVGAPWIMIPFQPSPEVAPIAVSCLRSISCGFLFFAYGMVFGQAFNGAGDTWTPTGLNLCVFWLLEIPLAWLLSHPLGMGPRGVFLAITIAFSTYAVAGGWLFHRGRWKTRRV